MKDYLKQLLQDIDNPLRARCVIREYLQARTLQVLQDSLVFTNWCFLGGTALRFLYGMPRFSEDLDFSLVKSGGEDRFRSTLLDVQSVFKAENYDLEIKVKDGKAVKSAFLRFKNLLFELQLSPNRLETLAIKIEIDTNPPAGAKTATSIVRKYGLLSLHHYDRASLLAGKLHALLMRRYTKGRDIYDLFWYLSDRTWPKPNLILLNNALQQNGGQSPLITEDDWQLHIREALGIANWTEILRDVRPFLERPEDEKLLTKDHLWTLLDRQEFMKF